MYKFLLSVLLFVSYNVFSQNIGYQNIKSLIDKFDYYINVHADSSLIVIDELNSITSKTDFLTGTLNYLKGLYQLDREQYKAAKAYFISADSSLSQYKNTPVYLYNKIKLGRAYIGLNKDRDSIEDYFDKILNEVSLSEDTLSIIYFKKSLTEFYKKNKILKTQSIFHELINLAESNPKYEAQLAEIYYELGDFYYKSKTFDPNNDFSKSRQYIENCLSVSKKLGLLNIYHLARVLYVQINHSRKEFRDNFDEIIKNQHETYELAYAHFNNSNHIVGTIATMDKLANIKRWNGDTEGAVALWDEAYKLSKSHDYERGMQLTALNIVPFAIRIKDYTTAEKYASWLEETYQESDDFKLQQTIHDRLSYLKSVTGDYRSAMRHQIYSFIYKDSVNNRLQNEKLNQLEIEYQTKQKEQEILTLSAQNKLIEQEKNNLRIISLVGIMLMLIIALSLFYAYKNFKKTNTKLKELDKIKSSFFTNISHEFRTPLSLISSSVQSLLNNDQALNSQKSHFDRIEHNSDRLLKLVNQLLDLSKIEAGALKIRVVKENLSIFVKALSEAFEYPFQKKNIAYELDIDLNQEYIWFDREAIDKIITNLLSNALKYTPKHGKVIFNCRLIDEKIHINILNTGKGLNNSEIERVFERFYRTEEDELGSGIGLALVKEIVDLYDGEINVKSKLNEWTSFAVTLPAKRSAFNYVRSDTTTKNKYESIDKVFDQNKPSELPILLIVEDNNDVQEVLKNIFSTHYNIYTANNGQEGFEIALEQIPDIIISDVMMPIKDGISLVNDLKKNAATNHIPVILLTAKVSEEDELMGINSGADDYIAKPFNNKLLKAKADKLIEIRQDLQKKYSEKLIFNSKDTVVKNVDAQFFEKIKHVFDEKLKESSFNVEEFSMSVGMSRMQLHRKLKALTGLSASEFIRSQRLKLAADLLEKSDINISQVGYTVGFNDHSYFTKCFKETFGVTPKQYINRQ